MAVAAAVLEPRAGLRRHRSFENSEVSVYPRAAERTDSSSSRWRIQVLGCAVLLVFGLAIVGARLSKSFGRTQNWGHCIQRAIYFFERTYLAREK